MPNRNIYVRNQTKTFLIFPNLPRNLVPQFLTFFGLCAQLGLPGHGSTQVLELFLAVLSSTSLQNFMDSRLQERCCQSEGVEGIMNWSGSSWKSFQRLSQSSNLKCTHQMNTNHIVDWSVFLSRPVPETPKSCSPPIRTSVPPHHQKIVDTYSFKLYFFQCVETDIGLFTLL
jgi:hypothetical protein